MIDKMEIDEEDKILDNSGGLKVEGGKPINCQTLPSESRSLKEWPPFLPPNSMPHFCHYYFSNHKANFFTAQPLGSFLYLFLKNSPT